MTLTEGTGQLRDRSLNWRHGNLKLRPHIVLDDPTLITFTVRAMAWQTRPVERPFNREVLAPSVMGITLKSNLIAFLEDGRKLLEGWAEEELAGPDS